MNEEDWDTVKRHTERLTRDESSQLLSFLLEVPFARFKELAYRAEEDIEDQSRAGEPIGAIDGELSRYKRLKNMLEGADVFEDLASRVEKVAPEVLKEYMRFVFEIFPAKNIDLAPVEALVRMRRFQMIHNHFCNLGHQKFRQAFLLIRRDWAELEKALPNGPELVQPLKNYFDEKNSAARLASEMMNNAARATLKNATKELMPLIGEKIGERLRS